jgi:PAS domain-containing protein
MRRQRPKAERLNDPLLRRVKCDRFTTGRWNLPPQGAFDLQGDYKSLGMGSPTLDSLRNPEEILGAALAVLRGRDAPLLSALDQLPAPIYVTDVDGFVTYFNPSCIGFAGRTPAVGKDRWCVTWKLYTEAGDFLPHDQCPMADAIRSKQQIRNVCAVAERPDGTRVTFMPYPTPLLATDGSLRGAVNMLIDVTDERQAAELRGQAVRCRRLAGTVGDKQTTDILSGLADEYEAKARQLSAGSAVVLPFARARAR